MCISKTFKGWRVLRCISTRLSIEKSLKDLYVQNLWNLSKRWTFCARGDITSFSGGIATCSSTLTHAKVELVILLLLLLPHKILFHQNFALPLFSFLFLSTFPYQQCQRPQGDPYPELPPASPPLIFLLTSSHLTLPSLWCVSLDFFLFSSRRILGFLVCKSKYLNFLIQKIWKEVKNRKFFPSEEINTLFCEKLSTIYVKQCERELWAL